MKLTYAGLKNKEAWASANIALPGFNVEAVRVSTLKNPKWLHFGAGNILELL